MRSQRPCYVLLTSYEYVGLLVSMALAVNVRDGGPQSGFRYELSSAQMSGIGCIVSSPPFPIRMFFATVKVHFI